MSRRRGILLDTTVVVDVLRNRNRRRLFLADLADARYTLATSVVTVAEVYGGIRAGEETSTHELLADLVCIPVSVAIAKRAGSLKVELRRQGQTRSITDMIIAATALEAGLSVATDNVKDFQLQGLTLHPLP